MKKKRIMLVDDEKDFVDMLKKNLERKNEFEVLVCSTTKGFLEQVNMYKPDLILLDLLMSPIGGLEICEMLNENPEARKIPIIIVSGLEKEVDKLKAYKLGVLDYLVKPIELDNLVFKIKKALEYKNIF
ncbi:MAG: response regulator [Omnitrophica bacterium]|nr:response regulator [Candidatus Omnitrophota bacterium]